MSNVEGGFLFAQSFKVVIDGNSLGQLAQFRLAQFFQQLRLPHQDQLHEQIVIHIDIGKHADFIQVVD